MKIGVLSDTHDQGDLIRWAVEQFNRENVEWVFHCGDWVSPFILYFFQGLRAPLRGVFGNNDGDKFRHLAFKNKWNLNLEYEERFLEMKLDSRRICVFHGHTHLRVNEHIGNTLSLNPGSLMKETSPTVKGASTAIYDTQANSATHILF
jgi:putative phosphoesterase